MPEFEHRHHHHHQQQLAWGAAHDHPSIPVVTTNHAPHSRMCATTSTKWATARECQSHQAQAPTPPPQRTFTTHDQTLPESKPSSIRSPWILSYNITEPAPTINVHVSALNAVQTALPDSGEDISVVGPDTITMLQQLATIRCGTQGSHGSLDDTNRPTTYTFTQHFLPPDYPSPLSSPGTPSGISVATTTKESTNPIATIRVTNCIL